MLGSWRLRSCEGRWQELESGDWLPERLEGLIINYHSTTGTFTARHYALSATSLSYPVILWPSHV